MFETAWRSPSNIAFVKYWGKKGHQLPANPSLSMTLRECFTETKVRFTEGQGSKVELLFEGKPEPRFGKKISDYLEGLKLAELKDAAVQIETRNTFPYGTGIASSASGLSAFALCLTEYLFKRQGRALDESFYQEASSFARLASGSASRSVYGGFTSWGECELQGSSDLYATPIQVHESLLRLNDTVIIVSDSEKVVSSRAGHERMAQHAYAQARFLEAKKNFSEMYSALKSGDIERTGQLLENEALQLHAMMMCSPDSFTLLRPNTLAIIEMIRDFRQQTKLPLYFTLDAGPNLHLIYPEEALTKVRAFIHYEIEPLSMSIIEDGRGEGPIKC